MYEEIKANGRKVRSIVSFDRGSGRIVSLVNGTRTTYELVGDELIYTYTTLIYNRTRVQRFKKKLPPGWKLIRAWQGMEKRSWFLSPLGKRFASREDVWAFLSDGENGESGPSSRRVELSDEAIKMTKKRRSEKNKEKNIFHPWTPSNIRKTISEKGWIEGAKKPSLRKLRINMKKKKEEALRKAGKALKPSFNKPLFL